MMMFKTEDARYRFAFFSAVATVWGVMIYAAIKGIWIGASQSTLIHGILFCALFPAMIAMWQLIDAGFQRDLDRRNAAQEGESLKNSN